MITKWPETMLKALLVSVLLLVSSGVQASNQIYSDAKKLLSQCHYSGGAYDQRSIMTVVNRNKEGLEKKSEYLRLLRYYGTDAKIREKMLLLTKYPPDAKGIAFLRWEYALSTEREVDQWLYMPSRKVLRRISARNDSDSFLGSVLTLGDIKVRSFGVDRHKITDTRAFKEGVIYTLESTPKDNNGLYSRLVKQYKQHFSTEECKLETVVYYDQKNQLLKKQSLTWQYVEGVPIWEHVEIKNVQSGQQSVFKIEKVEMNVGIKDSIFSKRTMRRGLK